MQTRIVLVFPALAALAWAQTGTVETRVEVISHGGQAPAEMVQHVKVGRADGTVSHQVGGGVIGGSVGGGPIGGIVGAGSTMQFVSAEMGLPGRIVKGAPYTADAVSETVQTLPDGNRITRRTTSQLARDSEGRTRRSDKFGGLGALPAQAVPELIIIHDPVAKASWVIDANARTARKMPLPSADLKPGESMQMTLRHDTGGKVVEERVVSVRAREGAAAAPAGKTESLGKRNVEGVVAEGSRSTRTIPAGEIGNDRPIEIVSERWYSSELQLAVMTRTNDPRFGETTYRLTNILRSEPPRSLFEVPPDYQVTEMKGEIKIGRKEKE